MKSDLELTSQPQIGPSDWLDAGYLALIFIVECWLWWATGFSWLVLIYGFVCACRGTTLSRMHNEGVWKRLWGKASTSTIDGAATRLK